MHLPSEYIFLLSSFYLPKSYPPELKKPCKEQYTTISLALRTRNNHQTSERSVLKQQVEKPIRTFMLAHIPSTNYSLRRQPLNYVLWSYSVQTSFFALLTITLISPSSLVIATWFCNLNTISNFDLILIVILS